MGKERLEELRNSLKSEILTALQDNPVPCETALELIDKVIDREIEEEELNGEQSNG